MESMGGCGELGAPWGVTSLPPARWGDSWTWLEEGALFREGTLYFKQGLTPGNTEASSSPGCRTSIREDVMGFLLINFFLHSAEFL